MTVYTLKYHQGRTSCTVTSFSLRPWNLSFPYFLDTLQAEVSAWLLAFLVRVNYQSRSGGVAKSHAGKKPLN